MPPGGIRSHAKRPFICPHQVRPRTLLLFISIVRYINSTAGHGDNKTRMHPKNTQPPNIYTPHSVVAPTHVPPKILYIVGARGDQVSTALVRRGGGIGHTSQNPRISLQNPVPPYVYTPDLVMIVILRGTILNTR